MLYTGIVTELLAVLCVASEANRATLQVYDDLGNRMVTVGYRASPVVLSGGDPPDFVTINGDIILACE